MTLTFIGDVIKTSIWFWIIALVSKINIYSMVNAEASFSFYKSSLTEKTLARLYINL